MSTTRSAAREQFLADVIVCAVEGGTGYWAQVSAYRHSDGPAATFAVLHEMSEDGDDYSEQGARLDLDAVARGIGRLQRGEVKVNGELLGSILAANATNDACEIDADGADVIAQAALLGDVIYG